MQCVYESSADVSTSSQSATTRAEHSDNHLSGTAGIANSHSANSNSHLAVSGSANKNSQFSVSNSGNAELNTVIPPLIPALNALEMQLRIGQLEALVVSLTQNINMNNRLAQPSLNNLFGQANMDTGINLNDGLVQHNLNNGLNQSNQNSGLNQANQNNSLNQFNLNQHNANNDPIQPNQNNLFFPAIDPEPICRHLFEIYCKSCSPYFLPYIGQFEDMMAKDDTLKFSIYALASLKTQGHAIEVANNYFKLAKQSIPSPGSHLTISGTFALLHLSHAAFST